MPEINKIPVLSPVAIVRVQKLLHKRDRAIAKEVGLSVENVKEIREWLRCNNLEQGINTEDEYLTTAIGFKQIYALSMEQFNRNPNKSWLQVCKDSLLAQGRLLGIERQKQVVRVEEQLEFEFDDEFIE